MPILGPRKLRSNQVSDLPQVTQPIHSLQRLLIPKTTWTCYASLPLLPLFLEKKHSRRTLNPSISRIFTLLEVEEGKPYKTCLRAHTHRTTTEQNEQSQTKEQVCWLSSGRSLVWGLRHIRAAAVGMSPGFACRPLAKAPPET